MGLVKAKCTQCGGELDVNPDSECLICKYCGMPFIVQKAINNYNTTNINNSVTNVQAENVVINGFNEHAELEKARKLIGKDNNLASKIYANIFENNPNNVEARYLRIILNEEKHSVNVAVDKLVYNANLNMNVHEAEYHQEDQPIYSELDKINARDKLFEYCKETDDEKIKETVKKVYPIETILSCKSVYTSCEPVMHSTQALSLYSRDEVVAHLKEKIQTSHESFNQEKENGRENTYEYKILKHYERQLSEIDPAYVPLPIKKSDIKTNGCYVATCVYGSYDCPEVWVLRRFRDYKLNCTWGGRLFIKIYYAISPTLVKWFGHTKWFKAMWRGKLDRMVEKYKAEGFDDTPYNDLY